MSHYLITFSIGPVQDFIAAARKTRDLWMGSYLLSEISKAAAKALHEKNAELIFPNPEKPDTDLEPCKKAEDCYNVGNKVLALIETEHPADTVNQVQQATQERWEAIANKAKNTKGINVDETLWNQQLGDVIEFFAAWLPYDKDNNETRDYYKKQRKRLDQLLNARKNTRDFIQSPVSGNGIPKSALDGLRESVIDPKKIKQKVLRRARLNKGEYLDCTGIAKRLAEDNMLEQFTPLSRLAIDPWLRQLKKPTDSEELENRMKPLIQEGIVSRVKGNKEGGISIYADFPYDGQLLYDFRIQAEKNKPENKDAKEQLEALETLTTQLKNPNGKPSPYMAILAADGDRMGELLDQMQTLEAHKNISATLTQFAQQVPQIVRDYRGHCVYAGGDDVLALLPLDQAIACSKALADKFSEIMRKVDGIEDEKVPTLSVGLGISHFMTPMPKQLDLARKAEKLAKGNELPNDLPKNALAIILSPRSGVEISFREKWDKDAERILCKWVEAHLSGDIPRQAGYNLRDEAIALSWVKDDPEKYQTLVDKETQRILNKKRVLDEHGKPKSLDADWIDAVCERAKQTSLRQTADEMIMTYRIAEAYKLANKKSKTEATEATNV